MSAPTALVAYVLAQAGQRGGLMHLSSQRDTGALNPVCGANPVRSKEIRIETHVPADLSALCADCAALVTAHPYIDSIEEGLAVFLGSDPADVSTVRLLELPLESIAVAVEEHRTVDEESEAFEALVHSIREHGVLVPIVASGTTAGLRLVIGRRRLAAARAAGLPSIPTLVRAVTDEQAALDSLTENLHREDLNPIDQALAFQRALLLLEVTKEALAERLHVSRSHVSNTIRLLDLPVELQDLIATGALTAAHGRALLRFEAGSPEQTELAEQILTEGLSTKEADEAARRATAAPAPAPAVKLTDVSTLLALALEQAGLLGSKVRVTTTADRARIVLDVADSDLPRVLARLQAAG